MKIFRCCADETRAADVDLFDQIVEFDPGLGSGFDEWVQIHDHEIDEADAVLPGEIEIFGMGAAREDAAVNLGMKRLDASIHHFRKAGHVTDIDNGQPRISEGLRGTASRDELEAARSERGCKRNQAGFVRNTQNRTPHHYLRPSSYERKTKDGLWDQAFLN